MGAYDGKAALIDQEHGRLDDVHVSLATADPMGEKWFGTVRGEFGHPELDGHDVIIELPAGMSGKVKVQIDLTRDDPVVRLIGSGPAPV